MADGVPQPGQPELPDQRAAQELVLVASGNVVQPSPTRLILKRIVLTGYPLKIHKKRSVVRYMFFNSKDVKYFKPVEVYTKFGLRGHIKESLGTHGLMKCYFNDYIKSNDTVCMPLYRRVFPKWFEPTWKYALTGAEDLPEELTNPQKQDKMEE